MRLCILAVLMLTGLHRAHGQPSVHVFPSGSTPTRRPAVGAYIPMGSQDVHLLVDGREVAAVPGTDPNRWTWSPDYDIDPGRHTAQIRGTFSDGKAFRQEWGFNVLGPVSLEVSQIQFSPLQISLSSPVRQARWIVNGKEGRPGQLLGPGRHTIRLLARGLDGAVLEKTWIHQVGAAGQPRTAPSGKPGTFPVPQPRPGEFTGPRPQLRVQFPAGLTQRQLQVDSLDLSSRIDAQGLCLWQPDYDVSPGPHRIRVTGRKQDGSLYERSWPFYALVTNEADSLNSLVPSDGTLRETSELQVFPQGRTSTRPTLEAVLPPGKSLQRCVLAVDGQNLSAQVIIEGPRLRWSPNYDIQRGIHQAVVVGQATDGSYFYRNWTFEVP